MAKNPTPASTELKSFLEQILRHASSAQEAQTEGGQLDAIGRIHLLARQVLTSRNLLSEYTEDVLSYIDQLPQLPRLQNKSSTPVRFKDVPVNSQFLTKLGGLPCRATKISLTQYTVPKLNSPGIVTITVDPELNQDNCYPVS